MSPKEMTRILGSIQAFAELSPDDLSALVTKNFFPISRYEKHKRIALRGDSYQELAILLSGSLIAELNDVEGHSLTVETLAGPQIVASAVFFSTASRFPVDLVATSPVRLLRISRGQLLQLFQEYPALMRGILRDMGDRLQFLAQRLRMNQFGSIRQQLSLYLLDLLHDQGDSNAPPSVTLSITRQALADTFGVARQSLSRVLSELESQNILSCRRRTLYLLDLPVIQQMARGVE